MNTRLFLAGLALAAFLLPVAAEAHVLPGDPQTLEEQLDACDLDLFRTQRSDGTYYAALGNEALAEQYYSLIFCQAFRKRNPFRTRRDEDLARRLAPQMVDITLNLAYADALPSRSRRTARIKAVMVALLTEVDPQVLRSVVGSEARRARRRSGLSPEVLGAAVLGFTIIDLYDKVAWGPSFVVDQKMPQWFGSAGWSLDGAPLAEAGFDLLVQETTTHLQGLDAKQKIARVGGSCLHTHPFYYEAVIQFHQEESDAAPGIMDEIDVVGKLPYTAEEIFAILQNLGRSPAAGGTTGGGSSRGTDDDDSGFEEPTAEQRELRKCQDQCFNGFRMEAILLSGCDKLGELLGGAKKRIWKWTRTSPAMAVRNCRGDDVIEGLKGKFDRCVERCRLDV